MDVTVQALKNIGRQVADARSNYDTIWDIARRAALQAHADGVPETHIAAALGIDRGTIRRWLGKYPKPLAI